MMQFGRRSYLKKRTMAEKPSICGVNVKKKGIKGIGRPMKNLCLRFRAVTPHKSLDISPSQKENDKI